MSRVNKTIADPGLQIEPVYRAQADAFGPFDYHFLVDLIGRTGAKKLLDIGTGEGSFLIGLAKRTDNIVFDAIELNEDLVEMAKKNSRLQGLDINFQQAYFGADCAGFDYDLILARFAIEHIVKLKDIDSFVRATYDKLRPKGWLVIIEYYIHLLDIEDPVWRKFRESELATYESIKAHPRIALKLPARLKRAKYAGVISTINQISPSTVGADIFCNLVREYAKLYSHVAPQFWGAGLADDIAEWCDRKRFVGEPSLFTSTTIGQKV